MRADCMHPYHPCSLMMPGDTGTVNLERYLESKPHRSLLGHCEVEVATTRPVETSPCHSLPFCMLPGLTNSS